MKTRIPLSVKIGSWLGLNLVLLAVGAMGIIYSSGGVQGWFAGSIGNRLQTIGDSLARELVLSEPEEREAIVVRYSATYDLDLGIYLNRGTFVMGQEFDLPERISQPLTASFENRPRRAEPRDEDGSRGPPPPRGGERGGEGRGEGRPPPPPRGENTERRPPPPDPLDRLDESDGQEFAPSRRELQAAHELHRLGDPAKWWALVRVPVAGEAGEIPRAGALIAVSRSTFAFGNLVDTRPVIWAVVISFFVSVVWWTPLVLGMTRAMRRLSGATEAIAEGKFETRTGVVRRDEIGQLGESIDQMASRLDTLVNGQRKFLGDVAHELGSPIGRMQVGTSILEDRVPENLRPAVGDVREEVQEMSTLVGELLAFTKAEMRMPATEMQAVLLSEIVDKAIAREMTDRCVEVDVAPELKVESDPGLLLRVVGNIIRNSSRYAGKEANVKVTARALGEGRVELELTDDGPGVPREALDQLGEAFYRPDAARTREAGGFGLGLSIVKSGVAAMGGKVKFGNASPQGFVVTIELVASES
jgi:two-component system sensor histidine kinase CpxA